MITAVIMSGGDIDDDFALDFLKRIQYDFLIGADKGICFCYKHSVKPDYIVGDFDSAGRQEMDYYKKQKDITIHQYLPEKDATDTQIAVELACKLECDDIYIIGGFGKRMDHFMANIRVLVQALEKGKRCFLINPENRIWLTDKSIQLTSDEIVGNYISFFALGEPVRDLTLQGFKYLLNHYDLSPYDPIGVSNEMAEEQAEIKFASGILVIAECADKRED